MKKKIFIVGSGPLPNEKGGIRDASGLRTEQFFRPLQKQGHEIVLVCITNSNPKKENIEEEREETLEKNTKKSLTKIFRISRHDKKLSTFISTKLRQFSPDVCIGVNTFPSYILSKVSPKSTPFWADLNGWIMAEAQARGYSEDNNSIFANAWRQERQILAKADKISTVSTRQKFCTIGEMASLGLLQKDNFLEEKIFAIPNSTKFFDIDLPQKNSTGDSNSNASKEEENLFRKNKKYNIPDDAFIFSWIGGYNNWVDEKTLFEGLEKAMKKNDEQGGKKIHFVSTGGAIKNIAGSVFGNFKKRIDNSTYKDRFIFLGWIETKDMRKMYSESDAGINVDFACVETWTGARNRINEMLKFGLPIITTGGSEIGEDVQTYNTGYTVPNGDSTLLSKAIVTMAKASKDTLSTFGHNGQTVSKEIFEETMLTKPVSHFVNNPQKTCLPALPINSPLLYLKNIIWYLKKNGIQVFLAKIWQRVF